MKDNVNESFEAYLKWVGISMQPNKANPAAEFIAELREEAEFAQALANTRIWHNRKTFRDMHAVGMEMVRNDMNMAEVAETISHVMNAGAREVKDRYPQHCSICEEPIGFCPHYEHRGRG